MINPSLNAELVRYVIERAMLILTERGCVCSSEGEEHCLACEALSTLEQLGRADHVAGLLAGGKDDSTQTGESQCKP